MCNVIDFVLYCYILCNHAWYIMFYLLLFLLLINSNSRNSNSNTKRSLEGRKVSSVHTVCIGTLLKALLLFFNYDQIAKWPFESLKLYKDNEVEFSSNFFL